MRQLGEGVHGWYSGLLGQDTLLPDAAIENICHDVPGKTYRTERASEPNSKLWAPLETASGEPKRGLTVKSTCRSF